MLVGHMHMHACGPIGDHCSAEWPVASELWGHGGTLTPPQVQDLYPPSQRCGLCQNFKQTTLTIRLYKVRTNLYPPPLTKIVPTRLRVTSRHVTLQQCIGLAEYATPACFTAQHHIMLRLYSSFSVVGLHTYTYIHTYFISATQSTHIK